MQIIQIIQIREYSCPAWQIIQINNCIGNRSSVPSVNTLMNNRICYGTKRLTCKYRVNDGVNINNSVVNAKGGEKDACVAPPTKKKMSFRRFFAQTYDWKHLYLVYFSCTTFRHSATTPATLVIRKCTILRRTLWCSHYGVAKRQQFLCCLRTATLSLTFQNVVPAGWISCFACYIQVTFLLLYEHVRERVVIIFLFFFRVRAAGNKHVVPYDT